MKGSKKLSPLEELRQEKMMLKNECVEKECQITDRFSYMTQNMGSLLVSTAFRSFGKKFGFGSLSRDADEPEEVVVENTAASSSIMQTVWNGLQITYPHIREVVQPLLISFAVSKLKGLFTKKKKRK